MIITDEKLLRVKCEEVLLEEVEEIRIALDKELKLSGERGNEGVGLAAPQIGIAKKMAIVRLGNISIDLVNPVIEKQFDLKIIDGEGCLSFPGRREKTKRYNEVHVINGVHPNKFIATDMLAVVISHEIDHLNGILLTDVAIKEEVKKNKVRPNDLCPCLSGKKYKKCCLK
jgi:peptide deformylase